jgi:adenosylcobinamide kinase/adenosylcobinamide-phosphate guanylyltransferase
MEARFRELGKSMTSDELKQWMAERNLTLVALAKAMHVSRRGVDNWRAEGTRPIVDIALNAVFPPVQAGVEVFPPAQLFFITGGARSGKSSYAERLAARQPHPVTYLATLEPLDDEMRARIARHQYQRPEDWTTIEAPRALAEAYGERPLDHCVLIDCLSLWVSNRLLPLGEAPTLNAIAALEQELVTELEELLGLVAGRDADTIVVSNEVGSGVVPPSALGRAYRDLLGRANQYVAARADRAWLLAAGRPLELPHPGGKQLR